MEENSKSRMRLPTVFNWNSGIDRGQFFTQMILVLFVYFICVLIMELADPVPGTRNIPAGLAGDHRATLCDLRPSGSLQTAGQSWEVSLVDDRPTGAHLEHLPHLPAAFRARQTSSKGRSRGVSRTGSSPSGKYRLHLIEYRPR